MENLFLFKCEKILIWGICFIWLKPTCCYHFKLSERKTVDLYRCSVKNPSIFAICTGYAFNVEKGPYGVVNPCRVLNPQLCLFLEKIKNVRYKKVSRKYSCLGKENIEIQTRTGFCVLGSAISEKYDFVLEVLKRVKSLKTLPKVLLNT